MRFVEIKVLNNLPMPSGKNNRLFEITLRFSNGHILAKRVWEQDTTDFLKWSSVMNSLAYKQRYDNDLSYSNFLKCGFRKVV